MQILHDNTRGAGELKVQIDSLDDLWVLYNIIRAEDRIRGRTYRRVVLRDGDTGDRRPMMLGITVEKIEFHEFTNRLRVLGSIYEGPPDWISIGQHHTFNLEIGSKITIFKDEWYRNDVQRIRRNLDKKDSSMVLCCAIESGNASIALLSNYSLTPITEIKENIPGKRYSHQNHKESLQKFFKNVLQVCTENVSRYAITFGVFCGPGFIKERFAEFYKEWLETNKKTLQIRVLNASSGELSSMYEILRNGSLAGQVTNLKLTAEEMIMTKFIELLGEDQGMVVYGLDYVLKASQMGAVETLLLCDTMLRSSDVAKRSKLEGALNDTEKNRGTVHILSTANPAGEQLESYSNIAAILRYKLYLE